MEFTFNKMLCVLFLVSYEFRHCEERNDDAIQRNKH
jgi:hypothetical protein